MKCVEKIRKDAFGEIDRIKHDTKEKSDFEKYRDGIKLAFYLHQYANASLNLDALDDEKGLSCEDVCEKNNQ